MKALYAIFWCGLFVTAAIVGNSEVLLNLIPTWLLMVLFCSPWIFIATRAARFGIGVKSISETGAQTTRKAGGREHMHQRAIHSAEGQKYIVNKNIGGKQ